MSQEVEIWKDITGYEGIYQISNEARVKSLPGTGQRKNYLKQERILKSRLGKDGYYRVGFRYKTRRCFYIHQLVLDAFIGLRPDGMYPHHKDGNKLNNLPENLCWSNQLNSTLPQEVNRIEPVEGEIWKDVIGYTGIYQISNLGRIKSSPRINKRGQYIKEKILKGWINFGGYRQISLCAKGIVGRHTLIHHLVLESFSGPRPENTVGCHNDGNKLNNKSENLRWDTSLNNSADAIKHGTFQRGERNGLHKVTEAQVREMRIVHAAGKCSIRQIARLIGMKSHTISAIINRKTWTHIP